MNANELVERTVELLDEARECFQAANPYLTDEESENFAKDYQYYESLLSILSRSRIRVTADRLPDTEDRDKYDMVLAYDSERGEWSTEHYMDVTQEDDCTLIYWMCVPQLPEATT